MDWQNWEFALQVNNLADRRYASLRTVCAASARSVYPEPGRALMLSARVNF
jgi:outer membrane receptor protein involved in Fe transport